MWIVCLLCRTQARSHLHFSTLIQIFFFRHFRFAKLRLFARRLLNYINHHLFPCFLYFLCCNIWYFPNKLLFIVISVSKQWEVMTKKLVVTPQYQLHCWVRLSCVNVTEESGSTFIYLFKNLRITTKCL